MPRGADWIGWAATALFAASYFSQDSTRMRRVQAAAAAVWAAYGVFIHSLPVIVSNLVVISMALATARRRRSREPGKEA
ncbi:MAG: hypothetical protein DMG21_04215 [Acidobacteria bacterium]|nr:MAG: hypothetical protein DMG21_04215 [Acidobacteriota bacterium]